MNSRDLQLDIARGIAIFTVVLGHLSASPEGQLVYLFHMPFFFIISGYFHRVDRQEGRFFVRKALALLLPYFVYLFLIRSPAIASYALEMLTRPSTEAIQTFFLNIGKLIYGGDRLKGDVGVFWFVTTLFLTQQLFNFVSLRVRRPKFILAVALIFYGLAKLDQFSPVHLGLPWAANVSLGAFLFYAVGAVYGRVIFKSRNRWLLFGSGVIAIAAVILVKAGFGVEFRMKLADYGFFVLSPLAAFSITKWVCIGSSWLAQRAWVAPTLAYVGRSAITIMFVHRLVQAALPESFFSIVSGLTAAIITAICCLIHFVLQQTRLSRALFLGSWKDAAKLAGGWVQMKAQGTAYMG